MHIGIIIACCKLIIIKMPFWGDSKSENYRAKLEHKMCIAKEAPDPSFDLSDCNLSQIPPGVFSMCRVFRKE
ncbi:e3 ubiquitin-protein ligase LRSAM1, partial [Trichonephila clavata]